MLQFLPRSPSFFTSFVHEIQSNSDQQVNPTFSLCKSFVEINGFIFLLFSWHQQRLMACATLKRSLELDPLQSPRPTKRRRCIPLGNSPTIPPTRDPSISPFSTGIAKITTEAITTNIREEMRRLYRRKQLHFVDTANSRPISPSSSTQNSSTSTPPKSEASKDKPLFTFRQVNYA